MVANNHSDNAVTPAFRKTPRYFILSEEARYSDLTYCLLYSNVVAELSKML